MIARTLSPASTPVAPPSAWRDLLALAMVLTVVYLLPTGLRQLNNPDEGRYVEIAREMAVSHDWVSPRLNGVLYFEKPPLFYWLEALAISRGGLLLWALRFWPAFLAMSGVFAVYGTARALWSRAAGWWAALILATSLLYYGLSQIIILDMAVSVFITWAMCAFLLAVHSPPGWPRRGWCYALYASMALAVLTKGLIGLLIPVAVIFLWLLGLNRWRELRHACLVSGLILFFALAAPWHILAALAHPAPAGSDWAHFFTRDPNNQGFLWFYFWQQHVLRYADPETSHRVQPVWFYFLILPAGFLPWVFFLPQTIRAAFAGGWARLKNEPAVVLLLLWTLFPLFFFSVSSSKLIPYILPCVPPLALLTGRFLAQRLDGASTSLRLPLRLLGALSILLAVALPFLPLFPRLHLPGTLAPWLYVLAVLFLSGGAYLFIHTRSAHFAPVRSLHAVAFVLAIFLLSVNPVAAQVLQFRRPSTQFAADWLVGKLQPPDRVFTLWDYGPYQDLPVYLRHPVGVAGHLPDEQTFGAKLETAQLADRYPGLAEYLALTRQPGATPAQLDEAQMRPFLAILRGSGRVFVFVKTDQFANFKTRYPDVPAHELWRTDSFLIFSNQSIPTSP